MKLAIILRGISYYDNPDVKVSNSSTVDYRECVESMEKNLIVPLKGVFNSIDFFLVTYNSPKLSDLIETFKPIDMMIYPTSSMQTYRKRITVKLMIDCVELLELYPEYDYILMTRFDLYYYRALNMSKVDLEKFNFGWQGEIGQCDDSFWLFRRKHLSTLKPYLHGENFNGNSCHDFNYKIGADNCNYISKPLDPANNYHMPDFWLFARYLPEFRAGTYKLYDWPEKPKKKLAVLLRGIMYYDGAEKVCYSDRPVDYTECYESMMKNLITPLKTVFEHIDYFIVTYANDKMEQILRDFKPIRDMQIHPKSSYQTFRSKATVHRISEAMNLLQPYESEYDNVLLTRADLYYYNKPLNLDRVKLDLFNFAWMGSIGKQCCDSFWLFSSKYIPHVREHLQKMQSAGSNNCHNMNNDIPEDERNYISRELTFDSSNHTGYSFPDFWFFGRHLCEWDKKNNILRTKDGDFILYD